jgi:hypothetical protein
MKWLILLLLAGCVAAPPQRDVTIGLHGASMQSSAYSMEEDCGCQE